MSEDVLRLQEAYNHLPGGDYDPHAAWAKLIEDIRAGKMRARVGNGESPVTTDPIPEPPRGKYIKYAFDKYGILSTGKQKGRLRPHWNKTKLALKNLAIVIFEREYSAYEQEMRREDAKDGKAFQGITPEEFAQIAARSMKLTPREFKKFRRLERAARRARQQVSRKVNFGMIAGNSDRRAHAGV